MMIMDILRSGVKRTRPTHLVVDVPRSACQHASHYVNWYDQIVCNDCEQVIGLAPRSFLSGARRLPVGGRNA